MKRNHTQLISNIGELSDLFAVARNLNDFLQRIVELISGHMQSEVCSIYLYYEEDQELVLEATKGLRKEAIGKVRLKLGEGLTGLAVKELRPICVKQASGATGFKYFPDIGEESYESFLAVPISRGNIRIGAIVIQNQKKDFFTDNDIEIFQAITSQLANTIETAKLLMNLNQQERPSHKTSDMERLKFIKGRIGSKGFAFAEAVVIDNKQKVLARKIDGAQKDCTLEDFYNALAKTERQLKDLQAEVEERLSDVASLIFAAQILMLKDQVFITGITDKIEAGGGSLQAVLSVVEDFVSRFDKIESHYLREKKQDVLDIGQRLIDNMIGRNEQDSQYGNKIAIAQDLFPSDILKLSSLDIQGIVLLSGGITAHVSILARSLEIPLIIVDCDDLLDVQPETRIILDAEIGNIYVNPDEDVIRSFQKREEDRKRALKIKDQIKEETLTKDGEKIVLLANINLLSDLKAAVDYKAEGVGLYRTEFPFIVRSDFPSEEEQFLIYKKFISGMPDKEVTFRTLDIGGDKVLSYYHYGKERNPYMGMRSIRFSLKHKDIFVHQLKAILRAGVGSRLRIMFPMISSLDEFLEARQEVFSSIEELGREGKEHHKSPSIGMMVELPSVLEIMDELAQEADFFSIGTNDFIQYMLAVDRTNEKVADLYLPHHPGVLRALKRVVSKAQEHEKEVSVCGDMAQDPRYTAFLLGIGIKKLSLDARFIPIIQETINNIDFITARDEANGLLAVPHIANLNKSFTK